MITLLLLLVCTTSGYALESITLTNGEWPPYFSQHCLEGGMGTKICTTAFRMAGIQVHYLYMPWKRGLQCARLNQCDGTLGWRRTPDRERDFLISDSLIDTDVVFFHKLGTKFDWKTLEDIGHYRIGGTLGYAYLKTLESAVERQGGALEAAPTDTLNLMKLAHGRIDLFPCAREVGLFLIRTRLSPCDARLIQYHPRPLVTGESTCSSPKKHPTSKP